MQGIIGQENVVQKRPFNFGVCLGVRNLRIVYIRDDIYLQLEKEAEKSRLSIETLLNETVSVAMEVYLEQVEIAKD